MLNQLAQKYPSASEADKQIAFKLELQRKLQEIPTLKQRLLGAVKGGGFELVKVVTDNPFIGVTIEIFRGWLEA